MANGTYGTKRPAIITSDDVDIFYKYAVSRSEGSSDFSSFKRLDSSLLISSTASEKNSDETFILPGMYDLRLPLDKFGKKGIYTIYIKPKEVVLTVLAVSTLVSFPNVRGIVLDSTGGGSMFNNGNLVGYRVEYFGDDGNSRLDDYRIVTSNNKCEPVAQNFNNSSQSGMKYRFNDASNLVFCTLTPSSSLSFKSDSIPMIGKVGQKVALVNTKFNPVVIEVEMTDHDASTISTMLEGKQLRNLSQGLITTFDENGGIYHQAEYGNCTNPQNGTHHDFKIPLVGTVRTSEIRKMEEIEKNLR